MPGPVKVYDRPERTGPSPVVLIVILLVVLIAGYFLYRTLYHPANAQPRSGANSVHARKAFMARGNDPWKIQRQRLLSAKQASAGVC